MAVEPTYDELLDKWRNSPANPDFMAQVVEYVQACVLELWEEGRKAPYDLYVVDGRLIEAVAGDYIPTIRKREIVTADVAKLVRDAVQPPPRPIEDLGTLADVEALVEDWYDEHKSEEKVDPPIEPTVESFAAHHTIHLEEKDGPLPDDYSGMYVTKDGRWEQAAVQPQPQMISWVGRPR